MKARNWAHSGGCFTQNLPRQTIICFWVQLTELGHQEYESIYSFVLAYVSFLTPWRHIYEELKQLNQFLFDQNYTYSGLGLAI
jgi:hypothetical protein